jgi:hypothetical protein
MSSKKLSVGNDTYDYPITGTNNYGEDATGWADAITEAVKEVIGPGDISTTEVALIGTDEGSSITGFIAGLQFDTAFVQRIRVEGILTRKYTVASGLSSEVEAFVSEGAYNGSEFNITNDFSGDDTEVELFMDGGQYKFRYQKATTADPIGDKTQQVSIKFKAKVLIDEEAI